MALKPFLELIRKVNGKSGAHVVLGAGDVGAYTKAETDALTAAALAVAEAAVEDGVLKRTEKKTFVPFVQGLLNEQTALTAQAAALGVDASAYIAALTALSTYLATLTTPVAWNDLTGKTTIDAGVSSTKLENVATARAALLAALHASAAQKAVLAQVAGAGQLAGQDVLKASYDRTTFGANLIGDPRFNDISTDPDVGAYWLVGNQDGDGNPKDIYRSALNVEGNKLSATAFLHVPADDAGTSVTSAAASATAGLLLIAGGERYRLTVNALVTAGVAGSLDIVGLYFKADGTTLLSSETLYNAVFDGTQAETVSRISLLTTAPLSAALLTVVIDLRYGGDLASAFCYGPSSGYVDIANAGIFPVVVASGAVARGTATAGQTSITMAEVVPADKDWTAEVVVGGVLLDAGVDYTTDGSTTLHLSFPMGVGDAWRVRHVHPY